MHARLLTGLKVTGGLVGIGAAATGVGIAIHRRASHDEPKATQDIRGNAAVEGADAMLAFDNHADRAITAMLQSRRGADDLRRISGALGNLDFDEAKLRLIRPAVDSRHSTEEVVAMVNAAELAFAFDDGASDALKKAFVSTKDASEITKAIESSGKIAFDDDRLSAIEAYLRQ